MYAACCDARRHPFAFRNLLLDRQMQVAIGLSNSLDVCFGALDANRMSLALVDLGVPRSDEVLDAVHFPGVDDLLIEAPHEEFVLFQ
jgi:hypothetical protein